MEGEVKTSKSSPLTEVVSVGEWMLTLLISAIPVVNLVMFFVWAFGANTKLSKANWAKASLIWVGIIIAVYIVIAVFILGSLFFFFGARD
jgi:hypothetical protein